VLGFQNGFNINHFCFY